MLGLYHQFIDPEIWKKLNETMNGKLKKDLILPDYIQWGKTDRRVNDLMRFDFMRSSVDTSKFNIVILLTKLNPIFSVDWLLNNTNLNIMIYNNQLDAISPVTGIQ